MYFDENNNFFDDYYMIDDINSNVKNNNLEFNVDTINFNRNNQLYSIEEGFNKGNMFKDLYSKYKNHVYKLKVNNKKDELLYSIQMYTFALKDLTLYLDVHPTDDNTIKEFQKIKNKLELSIKEYEKNYGPLESTSSTNNGTWEWIQNPWPWDKGGN